MQIRRYTGPELSEVLRRIQRELGPNAAIINTRKIREGGFLGVLARSAVEVTVAVDYDARPAADAPAARGAARGEPATGFEVVTGSGPATLRVPGDRGLPPAGPMPRMSGEEAALTARRELEQMRVSPRSVPSAAPRPAHVPETHPSLSDDLERVHRALVRNQVEADLSRQILRVFDEQLSLLGEDWERAQPRFERYLAGLIRTSPGITLREGKKPVVVMFIGPTCVGKSTTIAKIASHYHLLEHRKVAIITADTYRMGATDQMRRYGEILALPVRVVETPEEMEDTLLGFSGYDLVLVDTAGRSPQNKEQILQMKALVEAARPDEIHLVVSMTTKYVDVVSIVSRFGIVPVNRVVLTKFDETRSFGLILNMSMKFSMDIAYITTGQQVPDDLETADGRRLARLVLTGTAGTEPPLPGFNPRAGAPGAGGTYGRPGF